MTHFNILMHEMVVELYALNNSLMCPPVEWGLYLRVAANQQQNSPEPQVEKVAGRGIYNGSKPSGTVQLGAIQIKSVYKPREFVMPILFRIFRRVHVLVHTPSLVWDSEDPEEQMLQVAQSTETIQHNATARRPSMIRKHTLGLGERSCILEEYHSSGVQRR